MGIAPRFKSLQLPEDLVFAFVDLLFINIIELDRLLERKDVLRAPVSDERRSDLVGRCPDALVAHLAELREIAFAGDDRTHDSHTGDTCDVRDDLHQLDVHLYQSFMHVLHVLRKASTSISR